MAELTLLQAHPGLSEQRITKIAFEPQHVVSIPTRRDCPPMSSPEETTFHHLLQYSSAEETTILQLLQKATPVASHKITADSLLLQRIRL